MVATETCPRLEDVAALLDGALADEERARLFHHIAECESCYELFAGAARLLFDEAPAAGLAGLLEATRDPAAPPTEAEVLAPPAKVVPLAGRRRPGAVPWLRWATALAAAALIAVVGVSTYRWWTNPPSFNTAALVEPLAGRAGSLIDELHQPPRFRGGDRETPQEDARAFQLGVQLVDLRLVVQTGDWKKFAEVLDKIAPIARTEEFVGEETSTRISAIAEKVRQDRAARAPSRLTQSADRIEADLAGWFPGTSIHLSLGEWTEAARLGALAGRTDQFRSWTSGRFLRLLDKQKEEPIDPEILGRLRRVEAAAAHLPQQGTDLRALAGELKSVIDFYDRQIQPR